MPNSDKILYTENHLISSKIISALSGKSFKDSLAILKLAKKELKEVSINALKEDSFIEINKEIQKELN